MIRTENDQLGQCTLDKDCLYGIHSLRGQENFHLNEEKTSLKLIRNIVLVKKACALSNMKSNLLDKILSQEIVNACNKIIEELDTYFSHLETSSKDLTVNEYKYIPAFITHPLQGGAGTSTNMNVNEVIANVALISMGHQPGDYNILHPVNHINMSQSTNDVYPSALKITAIFAVRTLADELSSLQESLQEKESEFSHVLKLGRTQLMDALPITLGQEFGAYAKAISRDRWRIYKVEERLREINLGGSAVGTGMNAPLMYIYSVTEEIQRLTGLGIARSDLLIDSTQNMDVFVEVSGLLKSLATNLIKISNDLRLMASGPVGGFGEIQLEAHQAGSSIMPGKTNPVICEMINQICFRVIGADTTITLAALSGQLELNPYTPLIASEILLSIDLLSKGIRLFNAKCIKTIKANEARCLELALSSYSLAAAFINPLGYDLACDIAKEAYQDSKTIKEVILERQLLEERTIDQILSIHQLTQPGIPGKH